MDDVEAYRKAAWDEVKGPALEMAKHLEPAVILAEVGNANLFRMLVLEPVSHGVMLRARLDEPLTGAIDAAEQDIGWGPWCERTDGVGDGPGLESWRAMAERLRAAVEYLERHKSRPHEWN